MEPDKIGPDPAVGGALPGNNNSGVNPNPVPQSPVLGTFQPMVITPSSSSNAAGSPSGSPGSVSASEPPVIAPAAPMPGVPGNSAQGSNLPVPNYNTGLAGSGTPPSAQPVVAKPFFSPDTGSAFPSSGGKPKRKKLIIAGAAASLTILAGLGYVFGFYIPNKPANVFQTGLNRSGDNLTKLVNKFTDKEQLDKIKNSQITATAEANSSDFNFNGAFDVKLSKTKSDGSLDISMTSTGEDQRKLNFKFLSDLPENKRFPNMYFQVNGLRSLGLDSFIENYLAFDGKWVAVDSDYLESISGGDAPKNRENVTSEEVAGFVRIISDTTNEYLLTADKDKAVLENKAFIGKETTDGIKAFRYEVGINKDHAKDFCKVLKERMVSHPVYKKMANLDDADIEEEKKNFDKDCEEEVKYSIRDNMKLEMWVDAKYKLVHKLRIYENKDVDSYTELGQVYKGGDNISFFINYHDKSSDAKFTVDVDTKTYTSKGVFTWKSSGAYAVDAKVTFEAKPYEGEVKADRPEGAVDVREIMKILGIEPPAPSSTNEPRSSSNAQSRAKDTERQTDIKALHGQLEAYYAQNGIYPVIGELNNPSWRSQNMRGLDDEALRDPDGSSKQLGEVSKANQYGYATTGCTRVDSGCSGYILTAQLSDGSNYDKFSLN
jgi:hypothetical protein